MRTVGDYNTDQMSPRSRMLSLEIPKGERPQHGSSLPEQESPTEPWIARSRDP